MATMLSTIANKGRYIKPHLVKQIIGKDETITIDKQKEEQVISEETAAKCIKYDGKCCIRRNREKC